MKSWQLIAGVSLCALSLCACSGAEGDNSAPLAYEGDEPGECTDGADNDQDQAFDCDDPGCAGSPLCTGAESRQRDNEALDTDSEPEAEDASESRASEDVESADIEAPEDGSVDAGPTPEEEPEDMSSEPVDPQNPCPPLTSPSGTLIELSPSDATELQASLDSAEEYTTFVLNEGIYPLGDDGLTISVPNTSLRSKSGQADAVILEGSQESEVGITIKAPGVSVAELTIQHISGDAIHIEPDPSHSALTNIKLYGLNIIDALERAIHVEGTNQTYADGGMIACSTISLSEEGREALTDECDIGGIDLRQAAYWTIRDNHVKDLWCKKASAQPTAILAWRSSAYTLIERNRIDDCTRGIGLGEAQSPLAGERTYSDEGCDLDVHVDHYRGVVRNNMLFVGGEAFMEANPSYESGIHLWSCCQGNVVHNTVVGMKAPYSSIEWRREGSTGIQILNNLVSHNLRERTGAQAMSLGNLEDADETIFINIEEGDLHLDPLTLGALNAAEDLQVGLADHDFEGDPRLGARDIGADEVLEE